jgi:hypothetical protein
LGNFYASKLIDLIGEIFVVISLDSQVFCMVFNLLMLIRIGLGLNLSTTTIFSKKLVKNIEFCKVQTIGIQIFLGKHP